MRGVQFACRIRLCTIYEHSRRRSRRPWVCGPRVAKRHAVGYFQHKCRGTLSGGRLFRLGRNPYTRTLHMDWVRVFRRRIYWRQRSPQLFGHWHWRADFRHWIWRRTLPMGWRVENTHERGLGRAHILLPDRIQANNIWESQQIYGPSYRTKRQQHDASWDFQSSWRSHYRETLWRILDSYLLLWDDRRSLSISFNGVLCSHF